MNKKITVIVLCLMLLAGIAGCGEPEQGATPSAGNTASARPSAQATDQATAQESAPATEPVSDQPLQKVSLQKIDLTICGAELTTVDGEEAICIYLNCVNTSDVIIQSSNEAVVNATQDGTELYTSDGEVDEQYELSTDFDRKIFPGVSINAAEIFMLEGDSSEIVLNIADWNDDTAENITFDLAALPPVTLPEADPAPVAEWDITSMPGYSGTEATFEDDLWPDGELKLVKHEFVEDGGDTFILLFFDLIFTGNLEDGETDSPVMRTHFYCFQDGVQLGKSSVFDDRLMLDIRDQYPELAAQGQDIGPNEPVQFATAYRLTSDADVMFVAGFNWSDFSEGETFIGDVFPVE